MQKYYVYRYYHSETSFVDAIGETEEYGRFHTLQLYIDANIAGLPQGNHRAMAYHAGGMKYATDLWKWDNTHYYGQILAIDKNPAYFECQGWIYRVFEMERALTTVPS